MQNQHASDDCANVVPRAIPSGGYPVLTTLPRPVWPPKKYARAAASSVVSNYVTYKIREGHNYMWLSLDVNISSDFDDEQQQFIVTAVRLLQNSFPSNTDAVQAVAKNNPRDNNKYPIQGRAQPQGRFVLTTDFLKQQAAIPRGGDANAIVFAIYCEEWSENSDANPGPGSLFIDRQDIQPSGNIWTLGNADINTYTNNGHAFRINLNGLAIGSSSTYPFKLDRLTWAATIQHEMLHNLGWDHPQFGDATYDTAWMIAYEIVTFPGASLDLR